MTFCVVIIGTVALAAWVVVRNILKIVGGLTHNHEKSRALSDASKVSDETVREMLTDSPLFAGCHEKVVNRVTEVVERMEAKPNHYIIREGEEGDDAYYIIVSGRVAVLKELLPGREETVAELTKGSGFGEAVLMQNVPRTRSVKSITDMVLLVLSHENFEKHVLAALGQDKVKENLQIRAFIEQIPLCRNWHDKALQEISESSAFTKFQKGQYALRKGGEINLFFYIVYEGVCSRSEGMRTTYCRRWNAEISSEKLGC